jgi:serine/threonine-protein kinase
MADLRDRLQEALADRYRIERELGRGGMATVFLAQDLRHDRPVALKVMHAELALTVGPERFLREVRTTARLQHPHILPLLDSGDAAGQLWYSMPFVEGESLGDRLRRERQLPIEDALRITREVADALGYAHGQRILHRDIKPANILLSHGHALVADFGIARASQGAGGQKLTETGSAVGTPSYMSPEQAMGDTALDGRSDLYSLGCVLYEMLTGEPPYTGPSAQAIVAKRLLDQVPSARRLRDTVPPPIDAALQRALAKSPADRYATTGAFAQALSQTSSSSLAEMEILPHAHNTEWRVSLRRRRGQLVLGGTALFGLVLAGALWERAHGIHPNASAEGSGPSRLAVLPFDNLGDSANAYFADGVADAVRDKLASVSGLEVIASASSVQYRHTAKPVQQVGKELGTRYLLTGNVRWAKLPDGTSRVQVRPQLVDAASGVERWGQAFDASVSDVFQVQADIASQVVHALNVTLGTLEQQAVVARPTQSLPAYEAYLKGEAVSAGLTRIESGTLRQAVSWYERAVNLDSTFVQAWLQLTRAHAILYVRGFDPTPSRKAQVHSAAERVAALRPSGWEKHRALALYYGAALGDLARGKSEATQALQLAPTNVDLIRSVASYERSEGAWEAVVTHLQQATALDPRSVDVASDLAGALAALRRYPEAREAFYRALALDPANIGIRVQAAAVRVAQGEPAEARAILRAAPEQVDTIVLARAVADAPLPWLLDERQQQMLLHQGPAAFDNDTSEWGGVLADVYRVRGDSVHERAYTKLAIPVQERLVRDDPGNADQRQHLAYMLAVLGQKSEAERQAKRALLQARQGQNRSFEAYIQDKVARIYLVMGEPEKALDLIEGLLEIPYDLSPGQLRIDPAFAPLRGNPRFERLVNGS